MELEIKPENRLTPGLKDLWEYRELFYFFTLRDIKIRYKQTVLGFFWAVIQPLLLTFIFSYFLGRAISSYTQLPLPYDIFALSGLVLWGIFSNGLSNAGNSMVNNAGIIRKIYFPRLIIPLSAVLVGLFDFLMAFIVFIIYCFVRETPPHANAFVYFPLAIVLTCVSAFGAGTLLAALNVKYRDFRYVIPFLIQFLLFLSPVIYPVQMAAQRPVGWLMAINPMTGPLELFRCALTGAEPSVTSVLISAAVSALLLLAGIMYFRKTEAYFADLA